MRLDLLAVAAMLAGSATLGSAAVGVTAIADQLPAGSAPAQVTTPGGGTDRDGDGCDHHGGGHRVDPRRGL